MNPAYEAEMRRIMEESRRLHALFRAELEREPLDLDRAEWYQRLTLQNTERLIALNRRYYG